MTIDRKAHGLKKLMRLAKAEIDRARVDLAELEAAKAATGEAIDALDQEFARSDAETDASGDPALLVANIQFRECTEMRRKALRQSSFALEKSEIEIRDRMNRAVLEYKKFEVLTSAEISRVGEAAKKEEIDQADDWSALAVSKTS